MNTRYSTNVILVLIGGFLLVASFAFAAEPFHWMMLAAGAVAAAIGGSAIMIRSRGRTQRGLDLLVAAAGAWTIIASLVFGGAAMVWLGFASGAAFVVLGLAGLTAHELTTERVVHSLEVGPEATHASGTAEAEREYVEREPITTAN